MRYDESAKSKSGEKPHKTHMFQCDRMNAEKNELHFIELHYNLLHLSLGFTTLSNFSVLGPQSIDKRDSASGINFYANEFWAFAKGSNIKI